MMPEFRVLVRPLEKGESVLFDRVFAATAGLAEEWGRRQVRHLGMDPKGFAIQVSEAEKETEEE